MATLSEDMKRMVSALRLCYVATVTPEGRPNLSPKGSLKVLDDHTVAYLDVVGSGAETIAHIRENGRIVVMLCAFDGPPRILRLHGRARVLEAGTPDFDALLARAEFDDPSTQASRRAIVLVDVTRVADSCGYGVPEMSFVRDREHLALAHAKKERVNGSDYREIQVTRNAQSIDGLPALRPVQRDAGGDEPDAAEVA